MKERELIEKAAKAFGLSGVYVMVHQAYGDCWVDGIDSGGCVYWNPLVNNEHAFSLAVKLGFRVCINNASGFSWVKNFEGSYKHGDDAEFATRLAIVMAAVAVYEKRNNPTNGTHQPT